MPTSMPSRRSTFAVSCIKCSKELIAPVKSEYHDGGHIRHMWLCPKCTACFDTLEQIPIEDMTADDVVPPLVA
jgi:transcriptional regulator NrdR family protein